MVGTAQYENIPLHDLIEALGGNPVAMLSGYLDDSSDDKRQRFASYGGVVGIKEQIEAFELLWLSETHMLTAPFRSVECECGHGQFEGWPIPRRTALMRSLVGLIKEQDVWGYSATVSIPEYQSVFPGSSAADAFLLCSTSCLVAMGVMGKRINHHIVVTAEHGNSDGSVLAEYNRLKALTPWFGQSHLIRFGFGDKRLVPLQSADLLAREAFKHFDNEGARPMRKPLQRLSKQLIFHKWRLDGMRHIKDLGYPRSLDLFVPALVRDMLKV